MFCTQCGKDNKSAAKFCMHCGATMGADNFQDTFPGASRPQSLAASSANSVHSADRVAPRLAGADARRGPTAVAAFNEDEPLWRAVIGPKKADHLMPVFAAFSVAGKTSSSWSWPASLTTFLWLLHRKLWMRALVYFFAPAIITVLISVAQEADKGRNGGLFALIWLVYLVALFALPGMWGVGWLYKKYKGLIAEAKSLHKTRDAQLAHLALAGGTGKAGIIYGLFIVAIFVVGMLAAIALPAYQDYVVRAKMSEVRLYGNTLRNGFMEAYERTGRIPDEKELASFAPSPSHVRDFSIRDNGGIQIRLGFKPVENKSFVMTPSLDENKQIVWNCHTVDVPARYMWADCRQPMALK